MSFDSPPPFSDKDRRATLRERRAELKLRIRRRGMFALPSLFTLGCLFCGFFGVIQAMNLRFDQAALAIFAAMIMDSLDGRVARMTKTQTAFGAELDSLADMVSFGAAPALIVYEWALRTLPLPRLAIAVAFVYAACAALRLARFNIQIGSVDKRFFIGLPSPAAAALVASFVWLMHDHEIEGRVVAWWALAVTLVAGLSMVTTLRYYSFKAMDRRAVSFTALAALAVFIGLVVAEPPKVIFATLVLYLLSGYAVWIYQAVTGRRAPDPIASIVEGGSGSTLPGSERELKP
ncbi:MAG: CDP-diacylglycerol--serine O-phosphatidyltransferase [Casimicrobiaceae bacterium]|nr:CDP-diacylglycerol--serine O-phosphatidyltransferase [Casimicrobiaceae bacterium]MDW8313080.1 CDP-diacylglycerol--serine O-phosphatidyltransferase [Burkholderiales bacterium]